MKAWRLPELACDEEAHHLCRRRRGEERQFQLEQTLRIERLNPLVAQTGFILSKKVLDVRCGTTSASA